MRKYGAILLAAACAAALAGCRRVDEREFTVSIPGLDASRTNAIAKALGGYSGVRKETLRFDLEKKCVSLVYDSMLVAKKNIEFAIAETGLEANGVTPESVGSEVAP